MVSDPEYINCYCFNAACSVSIFNAPTFSGVKMLLATVLEEDALCVVCGEEYISKPILQIKFLVYKSLHTPTTEIPA